MLIRIATWSVLLMIILLYSSPEQSPPASTSSTLRLISLLAPFALAYPHPRRPFPSGALLGACTPVLELLQLEIPGRTSSIADFCVQHMRCIFWTSTRFPSQNNYRSTSDNRNSTKRFSMLDKMKVKIYLRLFALGFALASAP
jgi:hypothetical protein